MNGTGKFKIKGIFEELLKRKPLFSDKTVLYNSYMPKDLLHRTKEVKALAFLLSPALKEEVPSNILIYGEGGSGKTVLSKAITSDLVETAEELGVKISVIYMDCELINTEYRALKCITDYFGHKKIPFTGWPTIKVYNIVKELIDQEKQCVIVILDGIDKLSIKNNGNRVIRVLTGMNSDLINAKISLIGISKSHQNFAKEKIEFLPYNNEQLEDILVQRAELAFREDVLDEFVIPFCVSKGHGNAKKAINLLRTAGEIAGREMAEKITHEHVKKAEEKIESNIVTETIRVLPLHQKVILYSVILLEKKTKKVLIMGRVYTMYQRLCKIISLDALTPRRVSGLISELDILGILDSKVISRGRYGRSKDIKLAIHSRGIRFILDEDPQMKFFTRKKLREL